MIIQNSFETVTGLPILAGYLLFFLFGSIVGSFLNVVIHRIPLGKSIVFPNSSCPSCQKEIRPYDNIPIFSWLVLGGKCRNCRSPISPRYPAVELLTAVLFVTVFWQVGFNPYLPVALVFVTAVVSLIFIDAEHMILPNVITYPLLVFALVIRVSYPLLFGGRAYFSDLSVYPMTLLDGQPIWFISLLGALLGGLFGGGSLWLVGETWKRLRGVDAMGLGDVKMMFGVGALLGWRLTFLSIFIGALTGAVAGILIIARHKDKDFQAQIPFGIFLGIGSIVALLFGDLLISWYIDNFIPG